MERLRAWASRDPGLALVVVAIVATVALYASTLGNGIINYDDTWLIRDNWIVANPSLDSVRKIFFDLSFETRHVLGAEYLPVRDLSVMFDSALWGYGGFHFTNVVIYVVALAMLFRMLDALGIDRTIAGLAILLFAIHPLHAESVAWLSERKGLLGLMFAAIAGFGYARFRAGGSIKWIVGAGLATLCAVWSKAPAAFTIAALGGLELVLPERRASWKRSLTGLAVLGAVGAAAFVPVMLTAVDAQIVGATTSIPADSKLEVVLGVHGFYLEQCLMVMPNALTYPVAKLGPTPLLLVLGGVGIAALIAPFVGRLGAPRELRAAAVIWTFAWFPVSQILLPVRNVGIADRYALVMVLGFALALATGIRKLRSVRMQAALVSVICLAAAVRTIDAAASWSDDLLLTERAVESNPYDGTVWDAYVIALQDAGRRDDAERAIEVGLSYVPNYPRLLRRRSVFELEAGQLKEALVSMRFASYGGDPIAMGNLAQILFKNGDKRFFPEALMWARKAARYGPSSVHAQRTHGMVALAAGLPDEALGAFEAAQALEPTAQNRYNTALALIQLGRGGEAIPLLRASLGDPQIGPLARAKLAQLERAP